MSYWDKLPDELHKYIILLSVDALVKEHVLYNQICQGFHNIKDKHQEKFKYDLEKVKFIVDTFPCYYQVYKTKWCCVGLKHTFEQIAQPYFRDNYISRADTLAALLALKIPYKIVNTAQLFPINLVLYKYEFACGIQRKYKYVSTHQLPQPHILGVDIKPEITNFHIPFYGGAL